MRKVARSTRSPAITISNATSTSTSLPPASRKTRIGNHTFRATGFTAYLKNKGTLETAQHIANRESPRTTKLYDRRQDEISLDEARIFRSEVWMQQSNQK